MLNQLWTTGPRWRKCNTFAIMQMFQAMSVKRYPLTNASIFHYTWCNFAFQSWHHKNDFQVENICVLSCQSHLGKYFMVRHIDISSLLIRSKHCENESDRIKRLQYIQGDYMCLTMKYIPTFGHEFALYSKCVAFTVWAAQHCSRLFSSTLNNLCVFCRVANVLHSRHLHFGTGCKCVANLIFILCWLPPPIIYLKSVLKWQVK